MIYFPTNWIKQINYASSSFSSWRRLASKPKPVTPAKAARTTDESEASVPVFGNLLLEFPVNSEVDADSECNLSAEVDPWLLSIWLPAFEWLVDVVVDRLVLVDCDVETDWLALADCDTEVD